MTKDGLRDKFEHSARAKWNAVTKEPIPQDMLDLLAKLK